MVLLYEEREDWDRTPNALPVGLTWPLRFRITETCLRYCLKFVGYVHRTTALESACMVLSPPHRRARCPYPHCVRGFVNSRGPFLCLSEEGGPDRIRTSCNSRAGLLFAFCATKSGALAWSGCSIHIPALASAPARPDTHKSIRSKPTDYVVGYYSWLECSDA